MVQVYIPQEQYIPVVQVIIYNYFQVGYLRTRVVIPFLFLIIPVVVVVFFQMIQQP